MSSSPPRMWSCILVALLPSSPRSARGDVRPEERPASAPSGFVDFNGYYDVRDFSVLTFNTLIEFPYRFQFFSLVNYQNSPNRERLADLETFYFEQHLSWAPLDSLPLALSSQWTVASGPRSDSLRLGILWRLSRTPPLDRIFQALRLSYAIDFHALQIDALGGGYRCQIEHVYRLDVLPDLLDGRVYVGGFTDHSLWFGAPVGEDSSRVVSELQLGVRLVGMLFSVAEARFNENLSERKMGLGLGLEYVVPFALEGSN